MFPHTDPTPAVSPQVGPSGPGPASRYNEGRAGRCGKDAWGVRKAAREGGPAPRPVLAAGVTLGISLSLRHSHRGRARQHGPRMTGRPGRSNGFGGSVVHCRASLLSPPPRSFFSLFHAEKKSAHGTGRDGIGERRAECCAFT